MNRNRSQNSQTIAVTITSDESARTSRAVARLQWRGRTLVGFGLSHAEVDNIGEQLAMAQAFSDLGHQLTCISR
ncbi:hypothetical protein AWC05_11600 [Mycobacterium florentinum]|uniref:Uncharacterized protein n=1 Tax=Mycobacterium florentinum TaxID=292462 RepID=A0A1X1UG39_MYCFL|nr:dsRBD fold-containing protein [Mycobacterium florentinum]MCV7413055.1 DUF1876 family protein [Mycobacterium florentinum]ORV55825.1 hypothetical protein AWC05_11600 [Mycobacterium florentinum]BBX76574.1 hypothetical protein MFLOJ_03610 [Mycobacterium florentinum]